ncbi:MAG: lipid-A-disaccharide synthase [uncultured bacterium]|nr:MAG: lipid-A-disaccharide synthase [uncultured bacterium]
MTDSMHRNFKNEISESDKKKEARSEADCRNAVTHLNSSVFIMCGEQSADMHGALLAKHLMSLNKSLKISGIGGKCLKESGVEIIRDNADLAVVGFWEVIKQYSKFKQLLNYVVNYIKEKSIDVVILIDYPGFNLRVAKMLFGSKTKVVYYITPQIWAWGRGRLEILRKYIHHAIVIFEFEKEFYKKEGISVSFVGHPLMDKFNMNLSTKELRDSIPIKDGNPVIAFLPGSRKLEIERLLPIYLDVYKRLKAKNPNLNFVVSAASQERFDEISFIVNNYSEKNNIEPIPVSAVDVNQIIKESTLAVVASGTVTLQTALYFKPMIVVYRIQAFFSYFMKTFLKTRFISLVNIVGDEEIVPELIQYECNSDNIIEKINRFLEDKDYYNMVSKKLQVVLERLGQPGASFRAAKIIAGILNEKNN